MATHRLAAAIKAVAHTLRRRGVRIQHATLDHASKVPDPRPTSRHGVTALIRGRRREHVPVVAKRIRLVCEGRVCCDWCGPRRLGRGRRCGGGRISCNCSGTRYSAWQDQRCEVLPPLVLVSSIPPCLIVTDPTCGAQ